MMSKFGDSRSSSGEEKSVIDRAFEGSVSEGDYKSFVREHVREQNTQNLRTTECTLKKNVLDFPIIPVSEMDDLKWGATDVLTIFYNSSKHKKIYFEVHQMPNPKFHMEITPSAGSIKKGEGVDITFKVRAFVTTCVFQLVRISLSLTKPSTGTSRRIFVKKEKESTDIGQLFVSYKIDTELSQNVDFDEIVLGEKIGRGGYGTVHKAQLRKSEVAVKMLGSNLTNEDKEQIKREVKLMKVLNSPYIVTFMGSTVLPNQPLCIVMEYVKGGSLSNLLQKTLDTKLKCKLALDVARGMNFLHSNHIFHRDIKPDNMLVLSSSSDASVNLKITDFGTSRVSAQSTRSTDPTYIAYNEEKTKQEQKNFTRGVGTLIYQAPELFDGSQKYSIDKADVFSFGMLLWHLFHQKEPYSEPPYNNMTRLEISSHVMSGKRLSISPYVLPTIKNLIERCWHRDPGQRPGFDKILSELIEIYESVPASQEPVITRPKNPNDNNGFGQLVHDKNVPIPQGNLTLIGWVGEISREAAEKKLENQPVGTFLFRYSPTTKSYVLSFVDDNSAVSHIAFITIDHKGKVTAKREDQSNIYFENVFEYIKAMKDVNRIKEPIEYYEGSKLDPQNLYDKLPGK